MRRPFADKRLVGPFLNMQLSQSSSDVYKNNDDVQRAGDRIVSRTPATVKRAEYQSYFETPSIYIDFELPSASPYTMTREYHSSSLTAEASTGKMSEFTMRFPAVESEYISESDFIEFMDDIVDDFYRVRIDTFELAEGIEYYHGHMHFSGKRRDKLGPVLEDEIPEINGTIRRWYTKINEVLNI